MTILIPYKKQQDSDEFCCFLCLLFVGLFCCSVHCRIDLFNQKSAVNSMYHSCFFKSLHLRCRAAQAMHTNLHQYRRALRKNIQQFADFVSLEICAISVFLLLNCKISSNGFYYKPCLLNYQLPFLLLSTGQHICIVPAVFSLQPLCLSEFSDKYSSHFSFF